MVGLFVASGVLLRSGVLTVPAILGDLAAKSGMAVSASDEVKNDVLFIGLKAHEPGVLMDLIAKADAAEWSKKVDGWVLTRSRNLLDKQRAADRDKLAGMIRQKIDQLAQGVDFSVWDKENIEPRLIEADEERKRQTSDRDHLRVDTTIGRFYLRAMQKLNFAELAIGPGERRTFSTQPGRMERLLRVRSADQWVYEKETQAFNYYRDLPPKKRKLVYFSTGPEPKLPVSEVRLEVTRDLWDMSVVFTMFGLDHARVETFSQSISLDRSADLSAFLAFTTWRNEPIALSPTAAGLGSSAEPAQEKAAQQVLQKPAEIEPIGAVLDEPLGQISSAEDRESIYCIPDAEAVDAAHCVGPERKLHQVMEALAQGIRFGESDGVVVGTAAWPMLCRDMRADRGKLQALTQTALRQRMYDLKTYSAYALGTSELACFSGLEEFILGGAAVNDWQGSRYLSEPLNRNQLRFFGALSTPQKEALWSGKEFPFIDVGSQARAIFEQMVYYRRSPIVNAEDSPLWADGVPLDLTVKGSTGREQKLQLEGPRHYQLGADEIAEYLRGQKDGFKTPLSDEASLISRKKYIAFDQLNFSITFENGVVSTGMYLFDNLDYGQRAVAFREFPAEIMSRAIEMAKQDPDELRFGRHATSNRGQVRRALPP